MRAKVLLVGLVVVLLSAQRPQSDCGSPQPCMSSVSGNYFNIPSGSTANAGGYYWKEGAGNPAFGAGDDNGRYPATSWIVSSGGYALLSTNWMTTPDSDGCILPNSSRFCFFVSDKAGEGSSGHNAYYVAGSKNFLGVADLTLLDRFGQGGTVHFPSIGLNYQPFPFPTIQYDGGTNSLNISWAAADPYGYWYSGDGLPGAPLITGYKLYYRDSAAPPTSGLPIGWYEVGSYPLAQTSVSIPYPSPIPGVVRYYAMGLVLAGGFETRWVGAQAGVAPTAAGVFAEVQGFFKKGLATLTWFSESEEGTVGFVVEAAPSREGPWTELPDTFTEPRGRGSLYTAYFGHPFGGKGKFFARVKALAGDGSSSVSAPVKFSPRRGGLSVWRNGLLSGKGKSIQD